MKHELKLLNILGYRIELIPNETKWNVIDENNKKVGTIQKKKLHSEGSKGPAVFGYVTNIDSDIISYNNIRRLDIDYNSFSYSFDIKNNNDHVDMNCGEYPSVAIWSKEHGYMNFHVFQNEIFANFKSKTKSFDIEETVLFKLQTYNYYKKEYSYQISYSHNNNESTNKKPMMTTRCISAEYNSRYSKENNLILKEQTWLNNKLIKNISNRYEGTIKETIVKNEMGIDAINHFRYLLNSILPFEKEIIACLLDNRELSDNEVALFLPDIAIEKQEARRIRLKKRHEYNKIK